MAESLAEKLKRLAREKAEARAKAEVSTVAEVTEVANVQPVVAEVISDGKVSAAASAGTNTGIAQQGGLDAGAGQGNPETPQERIPVEAELVPVTSCDGSQSLPVTAGPTHPLTMQFMELEQALDSMDAGFKTKLRDIHRHLGKDPDLVTQMTEAEIALVVKGLVIFANAEIVEPAKAKTVKAATAAAKKKVISADDL